MDKEKLLKELYRLREEEVDRAKEGLCTFYNAAITDIISFVKSN